MLQTECLCPSKLTDWNPDSSGMVLGGGAFGRWLGHEGGACMDGISALKKGTSELLLSLYQLRPTEVPVQPELDHAGTPIFDFQPPELWKINFYCSSTIQPFYSVLAVQIETRRYTSLTYKIEKYILWNTQC